MPLTKVRSRSAFSAKFVLGKAAFVSDAGDVAPKGGEGSIPRWHRAHSARNDAGASVDYRLQCFAGMGAMD